MARPARPELSLTEWAVLGLVAEGTTHGFAVARELRAGGGIGRVWTVHRPLVYRALASLERARLVNEAGTAAGVAGPHRTLVKATPRGKRRLKSWLGAPVPHVRDVRSHLLVKLALLDRAGLDAQDLLARQRDVLAPVLAGLRRQLTAADGFDAVLARWRMEAAQGVDRFLAALSDGH